MIHGAENRSVARRSAIMRRRTDICPEAIQAKLNKPPKSWATTATSLALVQAAPRGCVTTRLIRDPKEVSYTLMAANLPVRHEGLVGYLKKQAELEKPVGVHDGAVQASCPRMLEGNPDAPLLVERAFTTLGTVTHDPFRGRACNPQACCPQATRLCKASASRASVATRLDATSAALGWRRRSAQGRERPQSRVRRPRARKNPSLPSPSGSPIGAAIAAETGGGFQDSRTGPASGGINVIGASNDTIWTTVRLRRHDRPRRASPIPRWPA